MGTTSAASIWLVLLLSAVLANLPFGNERLFVYMNGFSLHDRRQSDDLEH